MVIKGGEERGRRPPAGKFGGGGGGYEGDGQRWSIKEREEGARSLE